MGSSGCQRSSAFKRNQDYYQEETSSYYSKPGSPPNALQRLERMGQPKKRVVVLDFWNDTPVSSPEYGHFGAEELKRGLRTTERMILPDELKSDLNTRDLVEGNSVKVAQLIREGRKLGVSVIVLGRIAQITYRQRGDEVGLLRQTQSMTAVNLEIKVFDVGAGREILSVGKTGEASNSAIVAFEPGDGDKLEFRTELNKLAIRNAIGPLISDVVRAIEKMSWEGRIAKIMGGKVYLNAGRASGLVVGDILKVITLGEDIYDPQTSAYLGRSQGQLKGTLEITDFFGSDGAVASIHSGAGFQESDAVQLY